MLWKVRARVGDRPGTLARLAARCGERGVNVLGLQVLPAPDGVVDELVLSTPIRWEDTDVVNLISSAGAVEVSASRCSLRALQDPTVRYLQAVALVHERGGSILAVLEDLLETGMPDAAEYVGHDELTVRLPGGEDAVIRRPIRFTPTERARAEALAALLRQLQPPGSRAGAERLPGVPAPEPVADGRSVTIRAAVPGDVDTLVAMHRRCSPRTLTERYSTDEDRPSDLVDLVRAQVQSQLRTLVAAVDDTVVGSIARWPEDLAGSVRCGLLVQDSWQRRGVGIALLTAAARDAAAASARDLVLVVRPGNDAVLRTVGRCGLTARLQRIGDRVRITVPLSALSSPGQASLAGTVV